MQRSRFTKEKIIGIVREQDAGAKTADRSRKLGKTEAPFACKARNGGTDLSDSKGRRQLEDENARLKRLLAESLPDQAAMKDLVSRGW